MQRPVVTRTLLHRVRSFAFAQLGLGRFEPRGASASSGWARFGLLGGVLLGTTVFGLGAGCVNPFNPCATLAERICQCEASTSARESCRTVRIDALQNKIEITDEEKDQCWDTLTTCDCEDLDENRVEVCGFVRD